MRTHYVTCAPPGLLVTIGLLWIMQLLIAGDLPQYDSKQAIVHRTLRFVLPPAPTSLPRELPPDRIVPPARLPAMRPDTGISDKVVMKPVLDTGVLRPQQPRGPGVNDLLKPASGDGPLMGIVMGAPLYPANARARNQEGYVTVQFDVSADGVVENVRVLESSHPVFEKPAVQAAYRFRFKPRIVDGEALASYGVKNRFRYELEHE
jgi:protein TonB